MQVESSGERGYVFIRQGYSGMYLDATSNPDHKRPANSNGNCYFHNFNGTDHQKWRMDATKAGSVYLVHKQSGKRLDGNGKQVYVHDANSDGYQEWYMSILP
jgi:hypothetical protein